MSSLHEHEDMGAEGRKGKGRKKGGQEGFRREKGNQETIFKETTLRCRRIEAFVRLEIYFEERGRRSSKIGDVEKHEVGKRGSTELLMRKLLNLRKVFRMSKGVG